MQCSCSFHIEIVIGGGRDRQLQLISVDFFLEIRGWVICFSWEFNRCQCFDVPFLIQFNCSFTIGIEIRDNRVGPLQLIPVFQHSWMNNTHVFWGNQFLCLINSLVRSLLFWNYFDWYITTFLKMFELFGPPQLIYAYPRVER